MDDLVLLRGPTGVGKTHLAEWVHHHSPRRDGPFVVADLLGVPEAGPEVAMFGVVKKFFTGVDPRQGWVELARGGTLFIDEIDKLSLELQGKLLRLLDRREYSVVGDGHTRLADLRLIVATNTDLWRAVQEGRFREDLYFRIDGLTVDIPPLKERRDEIGPWAHFMLNRVHRRECARAGREAGEIRFSDEAVAELEGREWPGNLRELESVVRRGYALGGNSNPTGKTTILALPAPPPADIIGSQLNIVNASQGGNGCAADSLVGALDRISSHLLDIITSRRRQGLPPFDGRLGELGIIRHIESRLIVDAIACAGSVGGGFRLLCLHQHLKCGNASRLVKNAQKYLETPHICAVSEKKSV